MTLSDFSLTLSQEKKCKVTLYDKVGNMVIIQCKEKKQRSKSLQRNVALQ